MFHDQNGCAHQRNLSELMLFSEVDGEFVVLCLERESEVEKKFIYS